MPNLSACVFHFNVHPSHQARGDEEYECIKKKNNILLLFLKNIIPTPLAGEGKGEGYFKLKYPNKSSLSSNTTVAISIRIIFIRVAICALIRAPYIFFRDIH